MKGRKPKDVALQLLTGNPGKRALPPSPARLDGPDDGAPFVREALVKPAWLTQDQAEEWDRLTSTLALILSRGSEGMILVACGAYADMREAERVIASEGRFYETTNKHGQTMKRPHPAVQMLNASRNAYHKALAELGASPVSHSRVRTLPKSTQQELPGIARLLS